MYSNTQIGLFRAVLVTLGAAALAFAGNCNALGLQKTTTTSPTKLYPDKDLVCQAEEGEMDVTASTSGGITFLFESGRDALGMPIPHTCCEVPHEAPLSVEECEALKASDPMDTTCTCGKFIMDQKTEDYSADGIAQGDNVDSYCLQETTTGGLETYRCVVTTGAPKENMVWHLIPVSGDLYNDECPDSTTCPGGCGVAMGTSANPKPGEYPPYGIVFQYDQYIKDGKVVLANFAGNWCHTGSFCLDDNISCDIKSAKVQLRTFAAASFTIVEVDTVQTFNGNSTSGNVPTDFLSTAVDGGLVVDPTEINTNSISINNEPVTVTSTSSGSDRNGDGFNDLRANITQASYQNALYPNGGCVPDPAKDVVFRGTFTDGKAWAGATTVNVVCN